MSTAPAQPADGARDATAEPAGTAGHPAPERPVRRPRRRATTPPPPGSDPAPAPEPERHRLDENDDRLRAEKPPHY
ncbi:hypothetical protein OVN18_07615 [Microcella daejeonensis]|uniref:Uncharacterized protein n=1 Tax=Microcella daejeonensis TaxID=2994971 RepID=A0A9E8MIZ4_9MICO|nr:hypothetical protein [Microcella daejeonensis]WAB80443.1 hypothetical protein OVN18_07615 [Microcella daejeonensis]